MTSASQNPPIYNINIPIGAAQNSPSPQPKSCTSKGQRGGARNSASRTSFGIREKPIDNLKLANLWAFAIDMPLNRFITIHWQAAGLPLAKMTKATGRYIDLLSKCMARYKAKTAWIWVMENADGAGGHCHIMAHIPHDLNKHVTRLQRKWITSITGKRYVKGTIRSKAIGLRPDLYLTNKPLFAVNNQRVLCYLLKGATIDAAHHHDLRHRDQGLIIGKRVSVSQNLSAKSRSACSRCAQTTSAALRQISGYSSELEGSRVCARANQTSAAQTLLM